MKRIFLAAEKNKMPSKEWKKKKKTLDEWAHLNTPDMDNILCILFKWYFFGEKNQRKKMECILFCYRIFCHQTKIGKNLIVKVNVFHVVLAVFLSCNYFLLTGLLVSFGVFFSSLCFATGNAGQFLPCKQLKIFVLTSLFLSLPVDSSIFFSYWCWYRFLFNCYFFCFCL